MTLPAQPPITLAQVRAEFGAPAGTPLHDFVRGGRYVKNIAPNARVPTSPPIRLAQLCGATHYQPLSVSGPTVVDLGDVSMAGTASQRIGYAIYHGRRPVYLRWELIPTSQYGYNWFRVSKANTSTLLFSISNGLGNRHYIPWRYPPMEPIEPTEPMEPPEPWKPPSHWVDFGATYRLIWWDGISSASIQVVLKARLLRFQ